MACCLASVLVCTIVLTMFDTCNAQGSPLKFGSSTFNITVYPGYQCKSISFDAAFTGSVTDSNVRVQVTLHEVGPTYEASVAWIMAVKLVGFTACVESSGPISGSRIVNLQYVAFVGVPTGGMSGLALVPLHTAGTKCVDVYPSGKVFAKVPHVFVTSVHTQAVANNQRDAGSVWAEEVTKVSFKICLRELKNFDGVHRNLRVDWLALEEIPSGWSRVQYRKQVTFLNNLPPVEEHHYSFCQRVSFPNTFYSTPTMITTASHKTLGVLGIKPDNNAITEWVEDVDLKSFRVCMKDIQPFDGRHDPVTVNYLAVGYLHPCLSVTCPWYEVCNAYGPLEARCECDEPCPDYEAQLCGSDGLTYKNYCKYKLAVCLGKRNLTIAHNGSCIPFVLHRGRVALDLASTEVQCKSIPVNAATFQSSLAVRVETSINYFNNSKSSFVHDAAVSWAEEISLSSFQVCALKAGRNDRLTPDNGLTFVDYIAYQGAPNGAVTGETLINNWWEGTTCQTVKLPSGKFDSSPYVVVTAEHMVKDQRHDAATSWVEEATADSFKVCLRELQDFDGLHSRIYVNWFAYNKLPLGMATERHELAFSNSGAPSAADNHAFCQSLTFDKVHSAPPTVIVSSRHSPGAGKLVPSYNSIATWVESIGTSSCKVCLRELHSDSGAYDPLTVNTLVVDCKGKEPDGCRVSTTLADRSFDLEFPKLSTLDYVILRDVIKTPLVAMSVCLWMKTNDNTNTGSLFSYSATANGGNDNEFLIYNYKGFQLMVNGATSSKNVSANDGKWHHICGTWRSRDGSWAFYKDGVATMEGKGMKTGHKIVASGVVVLGQDQDTDGGGFQTFQSFKGIVSNINVWSRFVPAKEIKQMATSCLLGTGDVMRWSDVKGHYKGDVKEKSPASCASSSF